MTMNGSWFSFIVYRRALYEAARKRGCDQSDLYDFKPSCPYPRSAMHRENQRRERAGKDELPATWARQRARVLAGVR